MRLGPAENPWGLAVCTYSPSTLRAADQCGERATHHVICPPEPDDEGGFTGAATCEAHAVLARSSSGVWQVHAFAGACGMPGSVWFAELELCTFPDEDGRALVGEAPIPADALA